MKNIYITQFNTPWSRNLMPLSAGLLKAYAITHPEVKQNCRFFIETEREKPESIVSRYQNPDVLAFSAYFWNLNQTLQTARIAKQRYPKSLVIVGGPSAPLEEHNVRDFFSENPFVDITVGGEGELVFADILKALVNGEPINAIDGICYRTENGEVIYKSKRKYIQDVSTIPSPFLDGTFDSILQENTDVFSGVVWETNRGCPFTCTFCFWGGPDSKISQFPLDRTLAELRWISDRKISYIFGADANFGILKRDLEIAKELARLNRETGYPKFFVINWTKNSTEKIFDIVDALKDSSIKFMMTTSVQSHNQDTLKAIRRENIRLESFNKILEEASKRNFHTYSELILGLPLETYESFVQGIGKVLTPNIRYHFNIYTCVLIPGTQMANPEYVKKYGLITRECQMDVGRTVLNEEAVIESQNVVIGTSTMPIEDWRRSHTFAYICKSIFGLRLGFFHINYLRKEYDVNPVGFFEFLIKQASQPSAYPTLFSGLLILKKIQDSLLENGYEVTKIEGVKAALFPEIALLLTFLKKKKEFYQELNDITQDFLSFKKITINYNVYKEMFSYQYTMIPSWTDHQKKVLRFDYDVKSYFENNELLTKNRNILSIDSEKTYTDIEDFLGKSIYGGMIFIPNNSSPLAEETNKPEDLPEHVRDVRATNNETACDFYDSISQLNH